ncbi:hypothetical protein ISP15_03990 [Dyella jejuensis]|uniref:Uncharacterized protein n=1 Tax=Dyella jejuensis TaxID=1432009 RepID=A0ABW8JGQ5_9GAMM
MSAQRGCNQLWLKWQVPFFARRAEGSACTYPCHRALFMTVLSNRLRIAQPFVLPAHAQTHDSITANNTHAAAFGVRG